MCKATKLVVWNVTLDLTFKAFKEHMCKGPSSLLPNASKPFQVEMDASDFAFGVSLYEDGKQVAFERKKTKTL